MTDLEQLKAQYRRALEAFIKADAEPMKALWSRSDDVTLANPLGPPVKGFERVGEAMVAAAATIREGEDPTYDVISSNEGSDLGYEVALQGGMLRLGESPAMVPVTLRVTTIFRREDEGWRVVHRHADTTTQPRAAESLVAL